MLQVATKMYSTVEKTVTTSNIKVGSPGQSQTLGPIQQDKEYLILVKYTKYTKYDYWLIGNIIKYFHW